MKLRIVGYAFAVIASAAYAQSPIEATLVVRADQPQLVIDPNIYGQFAEHLGRSIYEGVWVGENSPIPNTRGIRNDVVAALKELGVPVLRWPGGCFADEYHWRDGIGPRNQRPKRVNTNWGGVSESNAFGTHEFMDFAEMIGAQVYINGNVGTGTPQETAEWIEYMTSETDSSLAELRRKNGRDKPWKVQFFGVGNETWGCGGGMRPEYYADLYRHYSTFIKAPPGNRPARIASGANASNTQWTEVMMREATRYMDALSVHYYTLPSGKWEGKGSSTKFTEAEWHATLMRTLKMDEILANHSAIMDKYDPKKRVGLFVDEWGAWYDVEPGTNPGFLYQQNTMRDALVASINLNIFHKHADRVRMTNIAQMVNVLQAMILTDGEKMVLTPTYHVFHMYKPFRGSTALNTELSTTEYRGGAETITALHVSAAKDAQGRTFLAIANLDPNRSARIKLSMAGAPLRGAEGQQLTAPRMQDVNAFDQPNAVRPTAFKAVRGSTPTLELAAKSVTVLELK